MIADEKDDKNLESICGYKICIEMLEHILVKDNAHDTKKRQLYLNQTQTLPL